MLAGDINQSGVCFTFLVFSVAQRGIFLCVSASYNFFLCVCVL